LGLTTKHLLGIAPLSGADIELILETGRTFQEVQRRPIKKLATLRGSAVVPMFQPAYAADLISSLQAFATTVRQGIYGHTHMMEFRVIADANGGPLVGNQGIPAVSPIFGNNPAFVVLTLDAASRGLAIPLHPGAARFFAAKAK